MRLIFVPVLERIDDAGAQRNQSDAARDEHQVLAIVILHREAVAIGAAHGELFAGLQLMKRRSATADLADGEEGLVLGGAGRQRGRELAHPKQRHLGKLARAKPLELPLLLRVLEMPVKRPHLRDVVRHPVENRDLRQIDVFGSGNHDPRSKAEGRRPKEGRTPKSEIRKAVLRVACSVVRPQSTRNTQHATRLFRLWTLDFIFVPPPTFRCGPWLAGSFRRRSACRRRRGRRRRSGRNPRRPLKARAG